MRLPKKDFQVKVGPFWYNVIYSKDVAEEGSLFGSTNSNDQKIYLDPDRPRQKIYQTFIHEVMHACMFVSGLSYRFDNEAHILRPSEEDVVREVSMAFYQVMQDNPAIFEEKYDPEVEEERKTRRKDLQRSPKQGERKPVVRARRRQDE